MEPLTKSQIKEYKRATKCHICFKPFSEKKRKEKQEIIVIIVGSTEELHISLAIYNIRSRVTYQSYFTISLDMMLTSLENWLSIQQVWAFVLIVAKNTEDYISFSIKVEVDKYVNKEGNERMKEMELRFIDSIKFMSSSVDSLVNNLARGGHEFWGFENYNDRQPELLIQKG